MTTSLMWQLSILNRSDVPGKLDHASIVCYEVGCHDERENNITTGDSPYSEETPHMPRQLRHEGKYFKVLLFVLFYLTH